MFHEDHGEFILMGLLTLNSIAMIFSISHGEQEVSQLTGVNTEYSAVNKKWDTHKSAAVFSLSERPQNLCFSACTVKRGFTGTL